MDQPIATCFVEKLHLPHLTISQIEALNAPITLEKALVTIKNLANAKTGGPMYSLLNSIK